MRRADEPNLVALKNLLGLRDGKTATIPDAIGEALRIAVAEMSSLAHGYPRQDGPGPRSWEPGYEPPEGATVFGPLTQARRLGCNPGGEVKGFPFVGTPDPAYCNRLLARDEAESFPEPEGLDIVHEAVIP